MTETIEPHIECNYATVLAAGRDARLSALDDAEILPLFKRHGAILFRGFTLDMQEFDAITSRFCSTFVTNKSRGRISLSADGRTQTVNLGVQPFPLHSELSREPWKPDIAWFACSTPPVNHGETLLCDGLAIVPALSDGTRQTLAENRLEHKVQITAEECESWLGVSNPDADALQRLADSAPYDFSIEHGQYHKTFYAPALHKPMFCDDLAFANFLLFARYCLNIRNFPTFENGVEIPDELCEEVRQVGDKLTIAHKWRTDDLLMIDNTRFMHGRNAVDDPDHRIILTQFGYASFAPLDEKTKGAQPWRTPALLSPDAVSA